jgi:hypothetical protein
MRFARLAPVQVRDLTAAGTAPAADFDLDHAAFFLEIDLGRAGIGVLGMDRCFLERAPGAPGFPEREECMRRRAHLPRLGFAGPAHSSADPDPGPGPERETAHMHDERKLTGIGRNRVPRFTFF